MKRAGFTLVEFIIYIGITAMLLTTLSALFYQLLRSQAKNQVIAEVEQEGGAVMRLVAQTIRNASGVVTPALGTSSSTLSLTTYASSTNPISFDLVSSTIRITEGIGAPVALTPSRVTPSALLFENYSRLNTPPTIRIQFTLTHFNPSGRNEYSYTKTFYGSASLR